MARNKISESGKSGNQNDLWLLNFKKNKNLFCNTDKQRQATKCKLAAVNQSLCMTMLNASKTQSAKTRIISAWKKANGVLFK